MAKAEFEDSDLIKVLDPLEPYLKEVVLCGGWTLAASASSKGVWDVVEQQPHPYAELVRMDVANGRSLLAQVVYTAFNQFLDEL